MKVRIIIDYSKCIANILPVTGLRSQIYFAERYSNYEARVSGQAGFATG